MQPNLSPNYFNNDLVAIKNIKFYKDKNFVKDDKNQVKEDKINLKIEVKNYKNDYQKKKI